MSEGSAKIRPPAARTDSAASSAESTSQAHTPQDGPGAWQRRAPVVHRVRVARVIERDAFERTVTPCHSAKAGSR
jgi:hypothetical protein